LIFKFLSAAIAFAAAAIGAGWAVSKAGAAGLAGSAERPEIRTTAIIITALGEAIAIYGIVIAILKLGQPTKLRDPAYWITYFSTFAVGVEATRFAIK
jgi:V/A-type H+-transporting ATPase subunit K